MVKVVVDAGSDLVLGVQMIGPYASEIVQGAAVMIESELRARDVREIVFPHPTVSEIVRDALWEARRGRSQRSRRCPSPSTSIPARSARSER